MILDKVQMLNEQIAPARLVDEQRLDFAQGLRVDLPAFGGASRLAPAAPTRAVAAVYWRVVDVHRLLPEPFLKLFQTVDKPILGMG